MKHSPSICKFICQLCGSSCGQAHTLREHYRDVHRKEITIETANEGKTPANLNGSDSSANKHSPEFKSEKLKCICGTSFYSKSNLSRHIKKTSAQNININIILLFYYHGFVWNKNQFSFKPQNEIKWNVITQSQYAIIITIMLSKYKIVHVITSYSIPLKTIIIFEQQQTTVL